ncbi:MAG: class I SAM-dependent methyltransferase [Anaerolineales bacterium]
MGKSDSSNYRAEEVEKHFDQYGTQEWNRLVETPVDEISLYIHTQTLKEYVQPNWSILEIGAGAGRFTQVLAQLKTKILVGDISQVQLDLNKAHAQQFNFADSVESWQQVDICDMGQFEAEQFECVVAYGGPFSYVMDQRDRAMKECLRVLKPKGVLLLSVMSLWGTVHRHLNGVLGTPIEINQKIIETGDISPQTFPGRGNSMHMFRAAELKTWLEQFDVNILQMSASNGLSTGWQEWLKEIRDDPVKWGELLKMELEACAEQSSLNMGTHILAVARKN